jgi:hypothetical protein
MLKRKVIVGSNEGFDPFINETDFMIEEIVFQIESGEIPVTTQEIKTPEAAEILKEKSKRLQRRIDREKRRSS